MSERAEGVSEIAQDAFEEGETVLIPEIFVDATGGAELDAGAAFGLFRGEAAGEVFGALGVEVRGDLAGEITITAAAEEEANPAHGSSPYSVRRACAGSSCVARQAGMAQATAAVRARTTTTVEKTLQSKGLMP